VFKQVFELIFLVFCFCFTLFLILNSYLFYLCYVCFLALLWQNLNSMAVCVVLCFGGLLKIK
jgi:hypothetical protein